jgi:hypothetical protein
MQIAKNFTSKEWHSLKLNENDEDDWQKAINVFKKRIYERYLEPIEILINEESSIKPKDKKFGFTILAIDLLLMETLQAFKEGKVDTSDSSKKIFKNFLKQSSYFSNYFSTEDLREKFYQEVRCGILHQAEVQSDKARIWSVGELYKDHGDFYTINRNELHRCLKKDFDDYITLLRDPSSKKERELFKKKMDAIAR